MAMDSEVLVADVLARITLKNPELAQYLAGNGLEWLIEAICEGLVTHITSFAEVKVEVSTLDVGLQQSSATPGPTLGPLIPKTLLTPGTIS